MATVILPPSLLPQYVVSSSGTIALASVPGTPNPGPDADNDGLMDDVDPCPQDSNNNCMDCNFSSWGGFWNCMQNIWNFFTQYLPWATVQIAINAIERAIGVPIPPGINPFDYRNRKQQFCEDVLGGIWKDGDGGSGKETGCEVDGRFYNV